MRITSCILLVLIALYMPFWVFVITGFTYALFFHSFELCIIAVCIDAQFGNPEHGIWYLYTLSALIIFITMMYVKPRLRFY